MTEVFDPQPAAALLAEKWRSGGLLQALPEAIRPRTLSEGYDVQDRLVALLGQPVVGFKLGVGSRKARRESGVGASIAGRVLAKSLYAPGDRVPLSNDAPVTVEFEIAYVLGRDVGPGDAVSNPMSVVGEVRAAFELVLSRFVDRRAVGWPSFAADDGAFAALILGGPIAAHQVADATSSLVIKVDGVDRARAATGDDETVPGEALADLLALARDRGVTLPRGTIVSTGTLSTPFNLSGAARIEARYLDRSLAFDLARPEPGKSQLTGARP